MNVSNPTKVFVSYSWTEEEKTGIVKRLNRFCQERDIVLIQDSKTLKHGALIKKFMDELSDGDHIITVFSQPYFESKWCMYELLRIYQGRDFEQRTHPVITEDCDLQDSDYRLKVVDFWHDKFKDEESKLEGRDAKLILPEHEQVKVYRDIHHNISELLNFAAGRVTTSLKELKKKNYSQLLDNIKLEDNLDDSDQLPAASTLNQSTTEKTENHTSNQHHLPDQPDNKFIDYIKKQIADELKSSDLDQFREVLKQELNKSAVIPNLPELTDIQVKLIVDGLISVLKNGGTTVPVITSVLTNAAMHCFDKRGQHYQTTLARHKEIKEAIEQMLGWMVLASVDDEYAKNLCSDTNYPGVYFELPVVTSAGVEFIVSRRYQHQAKIITEGSTLAAQNHLSVASSQFSWQPEEAVDMLKRRLWNQVFPDEKKDLNLSKKETDRLNAELEIRRADDWDTEHHLIAVDCEKIIAETNQEDVYHQLLKELSNLTLVQFGVSDSKPVFSVPEHNLMGAINRFLNKINKIIAS